MAIHHPHNQQHNENVSSLLDALYCDEEKWEQEEEDEDDDEYLSDVTTNNDIGSLSPLLLLEQDLFWEDEELNSLFSKEKTQQQEYSYNNNNNHIKFLDSSSLSRCEAVEWMLKVNAHYGFSPLTATLAVTYFDRFLFSFHFQREKKPWMFQLVAVTCISLAAKVEETQVPLLLDLQVQESKYVFEAKTIQRMELLVLSTLKWKMHPVTPLSFLDHIITRLGLKTHLHWHFLRRCEKLLLSLLSDSRFVGCLPSVLATATMLHVIDQIDDDDDDNDRVEYKNQLLSILKINKEKVDECYNVILQMKSNGKDNVNANNNNNNNLSSSTKRKYEDEGVVVVIPGSPSGVIDGVAFSCDGSNDSWSSVVGSLHYDSSSEPHPVLKKSKSQGQNMINLPLPPPPPPLNMANIIVGIVATSSSSPN